MNRNNLHSDHIVKIMIEEVYEEETSRKNWDSSFIESIRNFFYDNGGITDKQLAVIEKRYGQIKDNQRGSTSYGN